MIEEDGETAGFGGIEVEDEATLVGPLVGPAFRGRKFGSTLLEASLDIARVEGVESLHASLGARNIGGRLLLERAGFRPHGSLDAVYRLLPGAHRRMEHPLGGVTTRQAGSDDVEAGLRLCHECLAGSRISDATWRRGIERGEVRIAEENDVPVALVRIDPAHRRVFHGVTAGARARGLGGYVLSEALEAYWGEHPGETLRLTVPGGNLPASRLYRRLGFAPWLVLQTFELDL